MAKKNSNREKLEEDQDTRPQYEKHPPRPLEDVLDLDPGPGRIEGVHILNQEDIRRHFPDADSEESEDHSKRHRK